MESICIACKVSSLPREEWSNLSSKDVHDTAEIGQQKTEFLGK